MSDPGFDTAHRRLAELNVRYVELVRKNVPNPREFYETARTKFADLPDLSGNKRLDELRTPTPGRPAAQGIADCTEWLDIAIAFEAIAISELLDGNTAGAETANQLHTIAAMEAVSCAQLEVSMEPES